AKLDADPPAGRALVEAASEELDRALEELRELARGIHPAVLTERGLRAALETLAQRSPMPVSIESVPSERLPEPVEAAAYYVAAEALTYAARYAGAARATVSVTRQGPHTIVEVADDGRGGADLVNGSGLRGLRDRVEALDGSLEVESPAGGGTRVRALIQGG
ncbi:MAG: sensor histidine kinase, partial [Gaiellaceae bacterium]